MGTPIAVLPFEYIGTNKAANGTFFLNYLAVYVTSFAILVTAASPARAIAICEEAAVSRPEMFIRILTKAPEALPRDLELVSTSSKPTNPFENGADRRLGILSPKQALSLVLRSLKDGEWEKIRELAHAHLIKGHESETQIDEAKTKTSLIALRKKLFSFEAVDTSTGVISTLQARNGHTYFAYNGVDKKIRVHDDTGKLLWKSPVIEHYKTYETSDSHPAIISLVEDTLGVVRLEYYTDIEKSGDVYSVVHSVDLQTGTVAKVSETKTQNAQLQFVVHRADGSRLFIRRNSNQLPFYINTPAINSYELPGGISPESFVQHPDGSVYFKTSGHSGGLYRIVGNKIKKVLSLEKTENSGAILLTKDGRVLVDHYSSSDILIANPKGNSIGIQVAQFAISALLETVDGRILFARNAEMPSYKKVDEIFEIQNGKIPVPLTFPPATDPDRLDIKLMESSIGPILISLKLSGVEVYRIGSNSAGLIGDLPLTLGDGISRIITGKNKAFVLKSAQKFARPPAEYDVFQIFGETANEN